MHHKIADSNPYWVLAARKAFQETLRRGILPLASMTSDSL